MEVIKQHLAQLCLGIAVTLCLHGDQRNYWYKVASAITNSSKGLEINPDDMVVIRYPEPCKRQKVPFIKGLFVK